MDRDILSWRILRPTSLAMVACMVRSGAPGSLPEAFVSAAAALSKDCCEWNFSTWTAAARITIRTASKTI